MKLFFLFVIYSLNIIPIIINCQEDSLNLDGKYSLAFTLSNQNIIIFSNKGFYTFNSDLSSLINSHIFSDELIFDETISAYYPSFSQYTNEEGMF